MIGVWVSFFIWTVFNALFLISLPKRPQIVARPLVSVLVPLRNEERNVVRLVRSLKQLTYESVEFLLLDDQSTDRTYELFLKETKEDDRFQIWQGKPLPNGWVGKVHACHQLAKQAKGAYLFFIDADVELKPAVIEKLLAVAAAYDAKLVTGFPSFHPSSLPLIGKWLVPLQHFFILFHLPLFLANYTHMRSATAAHGACLFFERAAYEAIGGHASVKSELVEDVMIARKMKEHRYRVILANVSTDVVCYMYETNKEVWEGFLKNVYVGLNRSPFLVFLLAMFYGIFYVAPLIVAPLSFMYGAAYATPLIIVIAQKAYVEWKTERSISTCYWMPISAGAFIALMYASMRAKRYEWKGRTYT
ncbi:cellulose synthase/poly-beta-1,6-N-acetylglucosamine synthase-like glycosyltransferase [Anoxybacillus tengchongensis]|uniref:Cellulose synthase/poly-beta-1,6-N-acetylglucosamine synthase-like glycosyltransferase n=1 Tax=Anoxybacillus tengchongensis TaxID=576944 RepID=A0A7X0DB22_9BACL|nr:glycosyltransferase family 2 protein [Anoxybacillus tengchongensis]MBB6176674.1 cellulose synthase/poly-beta-1,6-N-acetylglucosamine synthase-like glycosyltransferase [Anoxybacillus tengchongensis]